MAVDKKDGLLITDAGNHRVRRVDIRTGKITTFAGDGVIADSPDVGDDGPATAAHLAWPSDLAVSPTGDTFVADTGHHRIRRIDGRTGKITTVAGNGLPGAAGDGGPARAANLSAPTGLAIVARIAELHAARLEIRNREGGGLDARLHWLATLDGHE